MNFLANPITVLIELVERLNVYMQSSENSTSYMVCALSNVMMMMMMIIQSDSSLLANPQGNCQSRISDIYGSLDISFKHTTKIFIIYIYFHTTYP